MWHPRVTGPSQEDYGWGDGGRMTAKGKVRRERCAVRQTNLGKHNREVEIEKLSLFKCLCACLPLGKSADTAGYLCPS